MNISWTTLASCIYITQHRAAFHTPVRNAVHPWIATAIQG